MALKRDTRYPGRFTAGDAAHPQGAFKNRTAPGAADGSYLEQDWANDWDGFFARILTLSGLTPNGTVDSGTSSQYMTGLLSLLLQKGNNLSEILAAGSTAQTAARTNLGLGTASTRAVGVGANQIPDMNNFTSLLAQNGWFKFPNQMIMQAGSGNYSEGNVIALPIPFPTRFMAVTISSNPADSNTPEVSQAFPSGLTGFVTGCARWNGTTFVTFPLNCTWIAIGY